MDTLEDYLGSDYLAELQEIATVDRTIISVAATFSEIFYRGLWPYEFVTDANNGQGLSQLSQGTQAMVLTAMGRILGHCTVTKGTFTRLKGEEAENLKRNWKSGLAALIKDLQTNQKVKSSTFGDNNPLTLSHLSELYRHLVPSEFNTSRVQLKHELKYAEKELKRCLHCDPAENLLTPVANGKYYKNAFVPLRSLRAATDLDLLETCGTTHRDFFESTLHDHLSFSTIPDSRFDPAELLFCLEGLLLCSPESVDASLFDRVLEVLARNQNTSAHWRPNKPFIADSKGSIMLPVSVEGANSLMRSIAIMDDNLFYEPFTAKSLPLVQRFWHWLRARLVRFNRGGRPCIGWHSEHVNDPNLIHIWDTSQVAEFMISFKVMLERHIGTKSLRLSRLNVKSPRIGGNLGKDALTKWDSMISSFEPMLNGADDERIYRRIKSDFVEGWAKGEPSNFSMLLYGPPGTGKSSVAENLAEALNMPLITVTVSDFLGSGGLNVEARAKAIFQTLEAQDSSVILFDEIDSFFLDRDSGLYREQDNLFQFLTPGMLTKINELRKRKRTLFIIATNYENRIDPAIKRTGRIDKKYLLPLPDAQRRLSIMKDLGLKRISQKNETSLVSHSALFGYSDLKGAVQVASANSLTIASMIASMIASLKETVPSTNIASYCSRLAQDEVFPMEEFIGIIKLVQEANRNDMISDAFSSLSEVEREKLQNHGFFESFPDLVDHSNGKIKQNL